MKFPTKQKKINVSYPLLLCSHERLLLKDRRLTWKFAHKIFTAYLKTGACWKNRAEMWHLKRTTSTLRVNIHIAPTVLHCGQRGCQTLSHGQRKVLLKRSPSAEKDCFHSRARCKGCSSHSTATLWKYYVNIEELCTVCHLLLKEVQGMWSQSVCQSPDPGHQSAIHEQCSYS